MTKKTKKRILFLCGYTAFNFLLMAACMRVLAKVGTIFGLFDLSIGEVLSSLLAFLLPMPY